MKLLIYSLLTQTIIIFGRIRQLVEKKLNTGIIKDRTFVFAPSGIIGCCDCGLEHLCWTPSDGNAQLSQPLSPIKYKYKFRKFADTPSPFKPQYKIIKDWQDKWRIRKR